MSTLNKKMTSLADAVRGKSGVSGKLSIEAMTSAVNSIVINPGSDIDLSGVTVTADKLLAGIVAVDGSGNKVTGNIPNVSLSQDYVQSLGLTLSYEVQEDGYRISFGTKKYPPMATSAVDNAKITYIVDKDTYFDFKKNYSIKETEEDVERVKKLTESFDPIEVVEKDVYKLQ